MQTRLLLAAAALVLACDPGAPGRRPPVFRHISADRGHLRLGAPLDSVWLSGSRSGSDAIALPPGAVAGAQAVRVSRPADGVVREIVLDYEQPTSFRSQMARYRRRLGSPTSHHRPVGQEDAERVIWRDEATAFTLVRDPRRSASTIYGRLTDLARDPAPGSPTDFR
jgi:hypothetical protein